ncbi:MAG TPA: FAD-binding oxidoreductase [Candidatus Paceibacterota bacterium]|nr:FAD-binding oxidoreductase [Candidatus Paceibacterota bacterium]
MKINRSPWIHQLDKTRPIERLRDDIKTDIVIVGAGIAGIATAFFALKHTEKSVVVIEKSRIAHGATGHNAGQIVSYFERPFYELCEEFGIELAAAGQRSIELAWELFDEMYTEAGLTIPFSRFVGYDGLSTYDQVLSHLKNSILRKRTNLPLQEMWLSDKAPFATTIPKEYAEFYKIVPQSDIQTALETEKKGFVAVTLHHKGVVNSALFSEHVAAYLRQKYRNRLAIYEETSIAKIVLHENDAVLDAGTHTLTADRVVLCTNGFENLTIQNKSGMAIDTRFHHLVNGVVGRMSGYLEKMNKPPMAASYYVPAEQGFADMEDPYFYITRREYEYEKGADHNLICLGGPQHDIPDREEYLSEFDYPEEVQAEVDRFVHDLYAVEPNRKIEYQFTWHGLMGYTPSRVRIVGEEPKNRVLLYNLGCNGVGILPSIFGGKRIARIIAGEKVEKSIFDPRE